MYIYHIWVHLVVTAGEHLLPVALDAPYRPVVAHVIHRCLGRVEVPPLDRPVVGARVEGTQVDLDRRQSG